MSPAQYLDFCARCDLPVEERRPPGVLTEHVSLSLLSQEQSLDPGRLRQLCRQRLEDHGVRVIFATASRSLLDTYDYVISAVYGNPNLLQAPAQQRDHHFSLCEMMTVELPADYAGLSAMIVYGPFMTVDVLGTTGNHVLYHGAHGVHHVNVGRFADVPDAYQPLLYRFTPAGDLDGVTQRRGRPRRGARDTSAVSTKPGTSDRRSSSACRVWATSANAARRTTIQEIKPGWFSISASKLSACVSIADTMITLVRREDVQRRLGARGNRQARRQMSPQARQVRSGMTPARIS